MVRGACAGAGGRKSDCEHRIGRGAGQPKAEERLLWGPLALGLDWDGVELGSGTCVVTQHAGLGIATPAPLLPCPTPHRLCLPLIGFRPVG